MQLFSNVGLTRNEQIFPFRQRLALGLLHEDRDESGAEKREAADDYKEGANTCKAELILDRRSDEREEQSKEPVKDGGNTETLLLHNFSHVKPCHRSRGGLETKYEGTYQWQWNDARLSQLQRDAEADKDGTHKDTEPKHDGLPPKIASLNHTREHAQYGHALNQESRGTR